MKIYFDLTDDGYVNGYSKTTDEDGKNPHEYETEIPEGHEVLYDPYSFRFQDGKLIKDEKRQQEQIDEREKQENEPSEDEMNAIAIMELTQLVMTMKGGE